MKINNTTVANWTLTTSFEDYNCSLSGANDIKVYFKDNTGDMILDYINAGGAIYQSENQAVNTSVYQGQCGGSYSDNMHCPGYIDFGTVTIGAAQNQPPLANAGSDKTITLPINSVTLSGGASDRAINVFTLTECTGTIRVFLIYRLYERYASRFRRVIISQGVLITGCAGGF